MRIIAGQWRGRVLDAPKGNHTRPTTDRVRESLMSSLASLRGSFEGAVVLDAFAGSGLLAFEALSRGATFATLCDTDRGAQRVISSNAERLDCAQQLQLYRADVLLRPPARPSVGSFDLVFLDPPYATEPERIAAFLAQLKALGSLADQALVAYEYSQDRVDEITAALDPLIDAGWTVETRKKYGTIGIVLLSVSSEA